MISSTGRRLAPINAMVLGLLAAALLSQCGASESAPTGPPPPPRPTGELIVRIQDHPHVDTLAVGEVIGPDFYSDRIGDWASVVTLRGLAPGTYHLAVRSFTVGAGSAARVWHPVFAGDPATVRDGATATITVSWRLTTPICALLPFVCYH